MNEWEGLIAFGRAMKTGSQRQGALIQLEGDVAYLVNESRSLALKMRFRKSLGSGTFYATEAPTTAKRVERRPGGKVLFGWSSGGVSRSVIVPEKGAIKEKVEKALSAYFDKSQLAPVPKNLLEDLDRDILVTRLKVSRGKIYVVQRRSDGRVELVNSYAIAGIRGDLETEEVSVLTSDLLPFKGLTKRLLLGISGSRKPVSVAAEFKFGGAAIGLISYLVYEV